MLQQIPTLGLPGNLRVHYQHLASRVKGPRREIRAWRAWACWWMVRLSIPSLQGDPKDPVEKPSKCAIGAQLYELGVQGEAQTWHQACLMLDEKMED